MRPLMPSTPLNHPRRLADYSADYRMLILAAMAVVAGTGGAFSAWALLKLIAFATNVFWYGNLTFAPAVIAGRGWLLVLLIPVIGGLIVGLMARFGSDKIRGHGIPEAIEAILFGESKMSPKVAVLKPLSSGIVDRQRRAVRRRRADHHDRRRDRLAVRAAVPPDAAERKTLLVAGAAAGMTGDLRHARWPRCCSPSNCCCSNGGRAASCRWRPLAVAAVLRPLLIGAGPLFPVRRAFARRVSAGGDLRPALGSSRAFSLRCFLHAFIASRMSSRASRSTGCGGPRSALSWSGRGAVRAETQL